MHNCKVAFLLEEFCHYSETQETEISVENLIASLDVEEKARAKDVSENGCEGNSSANMVQKYHPHSKNMKAAHKPVKTTTFKKKKTTNSKGGCYTCGDGGHFARDYPNRADRKAKANPGTGSKDVNMMTLGSNEDGYGNVCTVLSVFQFMSWWFDTGANVHVCADISLFSSYQAIQGSSVLMGNGSHASVRGVGTIDLKFTSGKIMQLKNVQHVPTINKNLVSGSLLCKDGFKVVLESNKLVVSKHGQFIGKAIIAEACSAFPLQIFVISQ